MGHQPFERRVTDDCGMKHETTLAIDGTEGECALIPTQLTSFQHRPYNEAVVGHITSLKKKKKDTGNSQPKKKKHYTVSLTIITLIF